MSTPASFRVIDGLAGCLGVDDSLQLSELQNLLVVNHHSGIRHHIVGQISRQHLAICEGWIGNQKGSIFALFPMQPLDYLVQYVVYLLSLNCLYTTAVTTCTGTDNHLFPFLRPLKHHLCHLM